MSKSSKQRRSDDEFKPPSAKKSKHVKTEQEHTSVQRIRLLDLIKYNYLSAGEEVFVKEQEGVITDRGTIKVLSSSGYIEYSNPTSWTKQVTGRENGGWGQIRLKASKQTLASIKEQYQKNMSSLEYIEDPEIAKPISYTPDQLTPQNAAQIESAPSDLTLPLKVRFINDEDRVFKIIWVSPDFKEFHTEYQGTLYTNLADFVSKIFEDFQKPSNDPNAPPPGNLRFDELMYELSPGKWVRLAGNLFPSELMAQQGNQQNADQVNYQQGLALGSQPHLLQSHIQQSPLSFSHSTPTGDNCNHRTINNNSNNNHCNNSTGVDSHLNDSTATHNHSTTYDDYHVSPEDDDQDVDDDDYEPRRRNSLTKSRNNVGRRSISLHCYKSLVYVDDSTYPVRVNSFGPSSVRDILYNIFNECNLKHNNGSEADLTRDYAIEIEDCDFGGVKVVFPKSVASFPTKCKIYIRRKEPIETALDPTQVTEKHDGEENSQAFVDDKSGILLMDKELDKELDKDTHESMLTDKSQPLDKDEELS